MAVAAGVWVAAGGAVSAGVDFGGSAYVSAQRMCRDALEVVIRLGLVHADARAPLRGVGGQGKRVELCTFS